MILKSIVFFITFCYSQIISLEENIIYCLETNCNKQSYILDSKQIGDLTSKQFTLQFYIRINPQIRSSFIAQVQTDSQFLYISQISANQIQIQNSDSSNSWALQNSQTVEFKTNNWLAIYLTQKNIIIQDFQQNSLNSYDKFIFNSNTKFTFFNNGSNYWQGQACCIIMYVGISYMDNYKYILYNNKKPEAKLIINIQQEDTIQYILFDHSEYSYIVRMGDKLVRDLHDPTINKDYLQFSSFQYIYSNDVLLNQQYTFEFRIALSSTFTSNVILLNYSLPNMNIFIYLNGTKLNFKQNDIIQEFTLSNNTYYHFCIAVIQNLEETSNQSNINFYQFNEGGIQNKLLNVTKQSRSKILNNSYGTIQLGSQENQFFINEYFQLYHFRFYDGFFLDITSSIDPNCAIYLNDRCIICKLSFQLSDQHQCISACTITPIMTEFSSSHNQCTRSCKAQCATCNTTARQKCLTCYGIRVGPPYCTCPIGYFEDYVSPNCRKYIPEQSTQSGIELLYCQQPEWQLQTVTFNYKYLIPPQVALFLIGVNQKLFDTEVNLYIGTITEYNFQINVKCSFIGQFYKIQWMSSLKNHLLYQEGNLQGTATSTATSTDPSTDTSTDTSTATSTATTTDATTQQTQVLAPKTSSNFNTASTSNIAKRLLQTNQYTYTNPFTEEQIINVINRTNYTQILGWAQNSQNTPFSLEIVETVESYSINSGNSLNFVKYSTIQTDFQSYNYNQNLRTSDNSIQIELQNLPKSIKFVNIFQGMQKIDDSGNFSLNFGLRNSTFFQFSSIEQQNTLYGTVLFAAVQCNSFCTFKDLYITSCHLNYTQCICNDPTYYVNETNYCDKCDESCFQCQGLSTNCTSCMSYLNKTLRNGSCICLDSQYVELDACIDCHHNCLTCKNSTSSDCLTCKTPKIWNSNLCECPEGSYLDTTFNCQKCHPSCRTCSGGSAISCLMCTVNREMIFQSGSQLCQCVKGYYEQVTNCQPCNYLCLECTDDNQCTSCTTTRQLVGSQCLCKVQYYETNQKECQKCPQLCQTCQSDTYCDSCLKISNLKLQDNICICNDGYYLNEKTECQACFKSCKTCQDHKTCKSCQDYRQLIGSNCLCLDKTYEDENMNCIQCQQPCLNCANPGNKCLSCDMNRFLVNDQCICNKGYFQNSDGECQSCMKNCLECINQSSCTKCEVNRVIDQCQCEDGYYELETQSECKSCPTKCLTCNQHLQCTSCKNTMQLINNNCECLKGTYFDGNNCLSCNTQLGLLQESCDMIKNCGDGIQSITEECDDGNLINRDGCTDCKIDVGYQCQKKLLQQSFCYKCQEKCSKCQYINSKIICQQCIDGYFIQNNTCILCNQNCKHCTSLQVCTMCPIIGSIPDEDGKCPQCEQGEQLQDGICKSVCGDGVLGFGEVCDFGEQNGSGGCSIQCEEQKGFNCKENICNKIPEKQIDVSYVNSTTKTQIQINYNLKATDILCQSFQINIDNFTQNEFNYTFTIENDQCNFQFNYNKTITEQNLIRIVIPQALSRILDSDPREIVIIPRKQIYYSEQQIQQSKNVKSSQDSFKLLIQFLGPLVALLGGFSYYLTILDILSWINNLYYINIQFPLNVQLIFQNSLWDDIQLFPTSSFPQFNQPTDPYYRESPPHFLEKGTDPLFINNTFQTFGLFSLLIIGYFLAQLLVKTLSKKQKMNIRRLKVQKIGTEQQYLEQFKEQQIITNKYQKIFQNQIRKCKFFADNIFSYFIKLLNLCYLDLVSAIVLQLYCFDLAQISDNMILFNYILAYSSMMLCLYMLYLTWFACNNHLILMNNRRFIQIYGTIFENIKITDSSAILYSFINLLRKSAYIITVVYFYNKPLFQTAFSCLISFINVGFIICYNPFDSLKTLIQQGVPDFCIFLLMLVFTLCAIDDRVSVLSDATRYNLGWIIIGIILISILVQLFFILQSLINDLVVKCSLVIKKIKQFSKMK